jgi:hypothetical protein
MKLTMLLAYSLLIFLFVSGCYETKEYQFDVINLTDIESNVIGFRTNLKQNSKKLKIDLTKQDKIILRKDDFFSGYTIYGRHNVFFYPSIFLLEEGGTVEAFVYDDPIVTKEGSLYKISPCEGIYKYFLYLLSEDSIVRVFSEIPIINIEEFENSNLDIEYIEDPPKGLINEMLEKTGTHG